MRTHASHAKHSTLRLPHLAALLACSLALLSACGDKQSDAPVAPATPQVTSHAAPAPAPVPSQPAPMVAEETDASDKMQIYIACYNRLDGSARRTIARYTSWVKNMETGPSGKEKLIYGLYPLDANEIATCKNSFAEAAAQKPKLDELDAAAIGYMDALTALGTSVGQAYPYYDRENYKDDQFAKGKELHPLLAKDFAAFKTASAAFSDALEVENDKLLDAELASVEKTEGRKMTYWHMSLMNHAKQLIHEVGQDDFAVETAAAKLAAYEKVADEVTAYSAQNQAEVPSAWFTVEHAAEEFRKAAKERVRRLRDKIPYTDGEKMMLKPGSAWMVDGSEEKVVNAYNSLIESSNNLR